MPDNTIEIWKDIEGQEGLYQVSSLGRVRSLDRCVTTIDSNKHNYKGQILNPTAGKNHYPTIKLRTKEGTRKTFKVHRLVASAFLPNVKNKATVNHKDGNKLNNQLDNLEWATFSENNYHARRTVKYKRSTKEWMSKLVLDTATGVFYDSASEAAGLLGMNRNTLISWLNYRQEKTTLRYA